MPPCYLKQVEVLVPHEVVVMREKQEKLVQVFKMVMDFYMALGVLTPEMH